MAYCCTDFVPYLPTPWRSLEKLDGQIVQEFSDDRKSLLYFINWLNSKDVPGSSFKEFIQDHPSLCRKAVALLTEEERSAFSALTQKVSECANKVGSGVFFSGYEWLGLPEKWRGPETQESDMICYLENNREDLELFLEGLANSSDLNIGTYPRAALSAVAMVYRYKANDPDFQQTLQRVQRKAINLLPADTYNATLVKYGCTSGMGAFRGWLLENDPTPWVAYINKEILQFEETISQQKQKGEQPDPFLNIELDRCKRALQELARPWGASQEDRP